MIQGTTRVHILNWASGFPLILHLRESSFRADEVQRTSAHCPFCHRMLAPPDAQIILKYLDLPPSYTPSPSSDPKSFLEVHIHHLPPNLLARFASTLNIYERSSLPVIRNRRTQYLQSAPEEYTFEGARKRFPDLWESIALASGDSAPRVDVRAAAREGAEDEKKWAEREFLGGTRGQVGKLGTLLGGYEEERVAVQEREKRRERAKLREIEKETEEEFEESSDEEELDSPPGPEDLAQARETFTRLVKERFIYGLLEVCFPFRLENSISNLDMFRGPITIPSTGTRSGTLLQETTKSAGLMMRTRASNRRDTRARIG